MRLTTLSCAVLLAVVPTFAQDDAARRAATEVTARMPLERGLKGIPYSAETLIESSQQLADGNRINRKTTGRVYRDGEGRTRREEDRPNGTVMVSITDPVAGYTYSLDAVNKVAWRTSTGTAGAIMDKVEAAQPAVVTRVEPVRTTAADGSTVISNKVTFVETTRAEAEKIQVENAAAAAAVARELRVVGAGDAPSRAAAEQERVAAGGGGGRGGAVAAPAGGGARGGGGGAGGFGGAMMPRMRGGVEGPLEHKVIDGVPVEGRKTTTTIPAGQVGNEQPITIVSEQWSSADLKVLVLTRHSDPRTGESTYRLVNIVRAEPDRSLFMVPADYTVRDTAIRRIVDRK